MTTMQQERLAILGTWAALLAMGAIFWGGIVYAAWSVLS